MTTVYFTGDVAPHERASYWREVANKAFARHEFHSGTGPAYRGSLRVGSLGALVLSQFDCEPCRVERSQGNLLSCGSDDFVLTLQLAGRTVFRQDDRVAVLEAGHMTLTDLHRPCSITHHTDMRCLAIKMPRHALQSRLGNASSLSSRVLSPDGPLMGLVSGFVRSLSEQLDALSHNGEMLGEQVLDLVALALAQEAGDGGLALSSPRAMTLLRLKSVIEARLPSSGFKPALAAAEAGISVRYANMLLSQEGYSVERYIQYRRLERCRHALQDPKQANRTIGEIAFGWGFSDLSHFGRRFRAAYGYAPGDYRRRALEGLSASVRCQIAAE